MRLRRHLLALFAKRKASAVPGTVSEYDFLHAIEYYREQGAKIGNKVRLIGRLDGMNPHLVSIGDYSVIGAESALLTHCPIKGAAACTVGQYVYLAFGVLVLPGVSIGDYSIIGAGSVVTKDIPAGSIAAGNPCRVLRSISEAEKAHLIDTMQHDRMFGWSPRP